MKYEIIFKPELDLFLIEIKGKYSAECVHRALEFLLAHPDWDIDLNLLLDLREIDLSDLSISDLKQTITLILNAQNRLGNGKRAIVAPQNNQHKASFFYYGLKLGSNKMREYFHPNKFNQAIAWIKAQPLSSQSQTASR